ncbi:uncharacterized protein LOC128150369 [Harpia harpyja]|uniref:uncharacterized protein LOC128150369 n=1 Tax=Harpia harpyja TaxID=202280 RepID=UPI0022B0AC3A|nr:uncharacterized protein LOC128150369 [Harpia harpyja]XP_052662462.1 uncharacterized protein LOC128150369 [Harpia harpyja]
MSCALSSSFSLFSSFLFPPFSLHPFALLLISIFPFHSLVLLPVPYFSVNPSVLLPIITFAVCIPLPCFPFISFGSILMSCSPAVFFSFSSSLTCSLPCCFSLCHSFHFPVPLSLQPCVLLPVPLYPSVPDLVAVFSFSISLSCCPSPSSSLSVFFSSVGYSAFLPVPIFFLSSSLCPALCSVPPTPTVSCCVLPVLLPVDFFFFPYCSIPLSCTLEVFFLFSVFLFCPSPTPTFTRLSLSLYVLLSFSSSCSSCFFSLFLYPAAHRYFFLLHPFVLLPVHVSLSLLFCIIFLCFLNLCPVLHMFFSLLLSRSPSSCFSLSAIPLFLCDPLRCSLSFLSPVLCLTCPSLSFFLCPAPCPYYLLLHLSVPLSVPVFSLMLHLSVILSVALVGSPSPHPAPCPSLFRSIPLSGSLSLTCFLYPSVLPPVFLVPLACYPSLSFFLSFSISLPRSCQSLPLSVSNISFSTSALLPVPFLLFSVSSILPLTF